MTQFRYLLLLSTVAMTVGCPQASQPEAPNPSAAQTSAISSEERAAATVAAMLKLAEAGAWGAYVDDYYGESHKFTSDEDRQKLIERFEQKWGPQVVDGLRQAVTATTVIDAQGRAEFRVDDQAVFLLYPAENGEWKFHL